MATTLWIAEVLLGAIFLTSGTIKLTQPRTKMAAGPMHWAADVTDAQFRTIGALEVLGVLGLILAAATGAIATHARYGETERIPVPAVLLVVTIFVAIAAQHL